MKDIISLRPETKNLTRKEVMAKIINYIRISDLHCENNIYKKTNKTIIYN
jgi:hypothetical protein